jgi:phage terminase large subunit-like protein
MTRPIVQSPIVEIMAALGPHAEQALAGLSDLELAALGCLTEAWARPNQAIPPTVELSAPPPEGKRWPLWGRTRPGKRWRIGSFIGARGTGKTTPIAWYVHEKAMSGEWTNILCVAQSEEKAEQIFITAKTGLVLSPPPWERPVAKTVGKVRLAIWPNGATATISSCGSVNPRGPEYDGAWCTEINDWPRSRAKSTWDNIGLATRTGDAQILCDTTPRAGSAVIAEIKDLAETNDAVWWVRHVAEENSINLAEGHNELQRQKLKGTRREREELDGIEADGDVGMIREAWINGARRHLPTMWRRRIVAVDPSLSSRPGSNNCGVVAGGTGIDDQIYVTQDETAVCTPAQWAGAAIDIYIAERCDCMLLEKNAGGEVLDAYIGLLAGQRGWHVVIVELTAKVRHTHGTINIKLVHSRGTKEQRFEVAIEAYQEGRVSHVLDADLEGMETTLTTWESETTSNRDSPGDLDATTMLITEAQDLWEVKGAPTKGHDKLTEAARKRHQRDQAQRHRRRQVGRPADTRSRI